MKLTMRITNLATSKIVKNVDANNKLLESEYVNILRSMDSFYVPVNQAQSMPPNSFGSTRISHLFIKKLK